MQKIFLANQNRGIKGLLRICVVSILTFVLSLINTVEIFGHGGEDHGDQKPIAASAGQMNVRLIKTSAYEVLVKYPNPKPAEETTFRVFLTDIKTNAPIEGLHVAMTVNEAGQPEAASSTEFGKVHADSTALEATAQATDSPGVYEARVALPEVGQYTLTFQLSGKNTKEQVSVTGVIVAPQAVENSSRGFISGILWILIALLVLIALAALAYFLYRRPRSVPEIEIEPVTTYASKSEHSA